jgi:hypothetical protein
MNSRGMKYDLVESEIGTSTSFHQRDLYLVGGNGRSSSFCVSKMEGGREREVKYMI